MTQMKDEATQDDEAGKLFVGGLSWETSQEKLSEYFSRFGDVVDCVVMKNNESGRSRGFGFVTYRDSTCVGKVLSSGPHELDGRTIDPKVCSARSSQKNQKGSTCPKIFLGGLPPNCTETDVRSFFSRYGTVVEVVLMYDQEKKRARGFGFLSFETEDSVKAVCAEHFVKINGKQVEVKHAEPRDKNQRGTTNATSNQWGGPAGWGPGPMGPPGPMPGPVNWGWGPQPPYGGPQGGWGPQQAGGYGPPGYQNWGPGYGPYGPGPNYGPNYGGYGPGYGGYGPGYNGQSAPGGPPPPSADGYSGSGGPAPSAVGVGGPPAGPPGGGPGMGTYQQESSNYGPVRGGYGSGGGAAGGGNSGSGNYSSGGGSSSWSGPAGGPGGNYAPDPYRSPEGNAPPSGGRPANQSYHPYRR